MSIAVTSCSVSYAGNDVTVAFPTTFKFLASADLTVSLRVGSGAFVVQTLGVDYTVTGANADEPGGTVTMVDAPATGETLKIDRHTPITQAVNFVTAGPFAAATHMAALDKDALIDQELKAAIDGLTAGQTVTTATGLLVDKTFTTSANVEDTFPLSVAMAAGTVAMGVKVERAVKTSDPSAIFDEPPQVDWAPSSDSFSAKFISGLEPSTEYRITFSVQVADGTGGGNLPDASVSQRGAVSTGLQTFGGIKHFNDFLIANADARVGTTLTVLGETLVGQTAGYGIDANSTDTTGSPGNVSSVTTMRGRSAIAAGAASVAFTGMTVMGATSQVLVTMESNDATAKYLRVTGSGAGVFTVSANVNATATCVFSWVIFGSIL